MSLQDDLVASAARAATDGALRTTEDVLTALDCGARAAEHGKAVPLHVLLDVRAWLTGPTGIRPPARAGAVAGYDEWLRAVTRQARTKLAPSETSARSATPTDPLPVVLATWPPEAQGQESIAWMAAYRALASDPAAVDQILNEWRGSRVVAKRAWADLPKLAAAATVPASAAVAARWHESQCGDGEAKGWLFESVDLDAARMYLDAEDPPVEADQARRIRRLRRRERAWSQHPPEGFEEPDMNARPTLADLVQDSWEWKLVNGTFRGIGKPISSVPHQRLGIHVCWAHGLGSLDRGETPALRAVVALMIDDWRSALRDLPIVFLVHGGQRAESVGQGILGRGGVRWKALATRDGAFPDRDVVANLFHRTTWTADAHSDPGRRKLASTLRGRRRGAEWWCLVVLESDLPELGFTRRRPQDPWLGSDDLLPRHLGRVVAIDTERSRGEIYRLARGPVGERASAVALRPAIECARHPRDGHAHYWPLRVQALNMVVTAIEAMGE